MFVGNSLLPNIVENWAQELANIFHEQREILLENSNNEIRTVVRGLSWSELRCDFGSVMVGGESDEQSYWAEGFTQSQAVGNIYSRACRGMNE